MAGWAQSSEASAEADDFELQVQSAKQDLENSITRATLRHDPYRHVLTALASALGVFPSLVRRLSTIADGPPRPIDQETLESLGRTALILVERQAGDLLRARLRTLALSAGIALFACTATGFGLGWITRGDSLEQACIKGGTIQTDKAGQRFCAFWLDPAAGQGR